MNERSGVWPVRLVALLLFRILLSARAGTVAVPGQCAPGCQPLQVLAASVDATNNSSLLLLDGGSCYYAHSASSTPCLEVPPPQPDNPAGPTAHSTTAWLPSPSSGQPLPVLDLCNQVSLIWLTQGACVRGWERGGWVASLPPG